MNKILSNLFNKKEKWIKFLYYMLDFIISLLSLCLLSNKFISILCIIGILLIDIFNIYIEDKEVIENLRIEKLLNEKVKKMFFKFLFIFAIIPLLVGLSIEKANFWELFLGNAIPNILGALIVFSLINHMSKFNYDNFIIKILQTDYVINLIIKIFYYFCFFNSASFYINKNWKWTNIINNIYLFIVIISGLITGCSFVYRIFIDDKPFDSPPKKVYPTGTLYCGAAFLVSCGLPTFFVEVEISPILLLLNTITAFIIALALLYFVIRKSDKHSSDYPFVEFGGFTIIIILNCCLYIVHNVEDVGNITYQLTTGGGILIAVILALGILDKKIKKKDNREEDKQG